MTDNLRAPGKAADALLRNQRLINRIRNLNPQYFVGLIHSHFEALLQLQRIKVNVQELLGEGEVSATEQSSASNVGGVKRKLKFSKKRSAKVSDDFSPIFGAPLTEEIVERIYFLIKFLNKADSLKRVGLFRKSGSIAQQNELKEILNRGINVEMQLEAKYYNPHDAACVLKSFLRQLPEPLLTRRHTDAHFLISGLASDSVKMELLRLMMLLLPRENVTLLRHLLGLLHRTSEVKDNLMDQHALAIIFAPNLFTPQTGASPLSLHVSTSKGISIIAFMIEKAHEIFAPPRLLMQDIERYLEATTKYDVCSFSSKALGGTKGSAYQKRSFTPNFSSTVSNPGYLSSPDSCPSIKTTDDDSLPAVQAKKLQCACEGSDMLCGNAKDLMFSNLRKVSPPAAKSMKTKRSRSLGDALRFVFHKCQKAVHPHLSTSSQIDDYSKASGADQESVIDREDNDVFFQGQKVAESGDVVSNHSTTMSTRHNQVHVVDVLDGQMKTLETSEDLAMPSSVETITSNFLLLSNHDHNFSVSRCSRPSAVANTSSANSKSVSLKPTSPSMSKRQSRKIHQSYTHRQSNGFVDIDQRFATSTDRQQSGFMTSSPICERRIANQINDKSAKDLEMSEDFTGTDFNNYARHF